MNGVIGEVGINSQEAADHRHEPVVNRVQLVADHEDVEVGELLFEGSAGAVSGIRRRDARQYPGIGCQPAAIPLLLWLRSEAGGYPRNPGYSGHLHPRKTVSCRFRRQSL